MRSRRPVGALIGLISAAVGVGVGELVAAFVRPAAAIDEVLESPARVKAFYDIDTPITLARLRSDADPDYLLRKQIPGFNLYFSFTGQISSKTHSNRAGDNFSHACSDYNCRI